MVLASSLEVALIDLISSRESDLNDWYFLDKTMELPFLVLGRLRNTVEKRMMLKKDEFKYYDDEIWLQVNLSSVLF